MFSMFYSCEKLIPRKIRYFPLRNYPSLVLPRNDNITTLHYPFSAVLSVKVTYGRLKTKENFKVFAPKVVAVAYERWSLTRGSNYSDLTWERLVFKKLVAEESWSLTRGGRNRRFDCRKSATSSSTRELKHRRF